MALLAILPGSQLVAQDNMAGGPGTISIGTRNTFSFFDDDAAGGKGIGGQARVQFTKRINSEWFFDYITSGAGSLTKRNDYHLGWSLMFYPGHEVEFENLFQPYLLAGHCFDYSKVSAQQNSSYYVARWSLAAQAGGGTHLNISPRFDCSLSSQYMLHFGKELNSYLEKGELVIEKAPYTSVAGHLLFTISFNYKLN